MKEEAPAKQIEAAGKASTVRPGGLAGLVFGKGEESEDERKLKEEKEMPMEIDEEVGMNDIAKESGARTDFNL